MRSQGNRGSPPADDPSPPSPGRQHRVVMMELLGRGAHASPRCGCSVLEYVSVLAGERWSSRPQSVHPAVADVADMVNDQMSDDRRRLLTPLAPWLLGTSTADPRVWPAVTEVCVRAGLARGWERTPRAGALERRWAKQAICSALLTVAASADRGAADAALCQVLVDCVNECRRLAGEPAVDPRLPLAHCPRHLAVEPHLVWSPGCDWMELGYRPVHALSPEWPRTDQAQRGSVRKVAFPCQFLA